MLPTPMHETFDDIECDRDEEDRNHACGQHAAEHREAKKDPAMRTGSSGEHKRENAKNERECCHQDGTES